MRLANWSLSLLHFIPGRLCLQHAEQPQPQPQPRPKQTAKRCWLPDKKTHAWAALQLAQWQLATGNLQQACGQGEGAGAGDKVAASQTTLSGQIALQLVFFYFFLFSQENARNGNGKGNGNDDDADKRFAAKFVCLA